MRPGVVETEAAFQRAVIEAAIALGWRVHAQRPGRTKDGLWRTAIQGHVGWIDVVAVKGGRALVLELKIPPRRPTAEQQAWLEAWAQVPGVTARWVWPRDWAWIETQLKGG